MKGYTSSDRCRYRVVDKDDFPFFESITLEPLQAIRPDCYMGLVMYRQIVSQIPK